MKKKEQATAYYPVFLNISGRKCIVVGGGQVALRKVSALLEHGAAVEVISPDLCPELAQRAKSGVIRALDREYQPGDLSGAFVAIAATDNIEINRRVAEEARSGAILINVVDDAEKSNFIVPSYPRRGDIIIAVSTSGKSPGLARKIRTKLETELGDEYAQLARLVGEVRAELKRGGIKIDGDGWQEVLDLDLLLDMLRKGERERAKAALLGKLK